MRQYLGERAPALPREVLEALMSHRWPGNIRELQNAVQRAAILSQGKTPREADFLLSMNPQDHLEAFRGQISASERQSPLQASIEKVIEPSSGFESVGSSLKIRSGTTVQEMEKALILETLRATGDNRTEAAKLLGISIRTLRNKLHEYRGETAPTDEE
jgi:two-component system response regulator FlrC